MKLALNRGFYFPSCEIYSDRHAGFWEYGPLGVKFKNKFIELWRRELIRKDNMIEIDGSQILSESVFHASGHTDNFTDPITQCKTCKSVFRADKIISETTKLDLSENEKTKKYDKLIIDNNITCPKCNGHFGNTYSFNMMFSLQIGPEAKKAYLRPETCQSIFVDFPRLFKIMRGKLPLGIAQIGKSFRNEIAPRQSILRLREFYQAEIEIFCSPDNHDELKKFLTIKNTPINIYIEQKTKTMTCNEIFESGLINNKLIIYYLGLLANFYSKTGIDMSKTRLRKLSNHEKAFYSTMSFDFEADTSLGWLELVACNYRDNYDLYNHSKKSNTKFEIFHNDKKIIPHVFEMSMGIDRSLYSILEHNLKQDPINKRQILLLKPYLSPINIGVLSLVKKDGIEEKTNEVYNKINKKYDVFLDHSGSIGRRYRRLDEIGTPFIITIDHQTLQDNTVTIRRLDDMNQKRIKIQDIDILLNDYMAYPDD